MKNNFAKFVRYLEKQDRIKIESDTDHVYMMDGYTALKVSKADYLYFIRPLSGIFPEIKGVCYAQKDNFDPVAKIVPTDTHVKELFEKTEKNSRVQLKKSVFLLESSAHKNKKSLYRVFGSETGNICAVNEKYVDMLECCIHPKSFMSAGGSLDILFMTGDTGAALACPFRFGDALEFWTGKTF